VNSKLNGYVGIAAKSATGNPIKPAVLAQHPWSCKPRAGLSTCTKQNQILRSNHELECFPENAFWEAPRDVLSGCAKRSRGRSTLFSLILDFASVAQARLAARVAGDDPAHPILTSNAGIITRATIVALEKRLGSLRALLLSLGRPLVRVRCCSARQTTRLRRQSRRTRNSSVPTFV
jgi:hypothetical protein